MKKLLLMMTMLLSLTTLGVEKSGPSVNFEEGNFFAITQQFDQRLLDNFAETVLNHKGKELNIYFDTPGGSVIALSRMARIMKGSKIKFTCVANFAASAGFMLFQHCQNRILLSDGVLMSHNWAGGFRDEGPRILTMFNTIQSLIDDLEAVAIKKMSVDAKEYARLINSNLWMTSKLAVKYAAVDSVTSNVSCSDYLLNKKILIGYTRAGYFGKTSKAVYKSGCPLIQKVYVKNKSDNGVTYVGLKGASLFKKAQNAYKLETANWFYDGGRNF